MTNNTSRGSERERERERERKRERKERERGEREGEGEREYLLTFDTFESFAIQSGHPRNSDHRLLKLAPTHQSDKEFLFGA